jgi:hypothetical protein
MKSILSLFFVVCKADFVRRKALPTSDVKARLQPCIIKHLLAQVFQISFPCSRANLSRGEAKENN